MPISNSYPKRLPIEDQDLFIGTKAYNNRTVNYSAQSVADYLNINSKVAIGGQMSFQFTTVPNIPKTIAFDGGGGDNTAFSAITKLIVSAIDVSATNITIFLNYLNNSQVLLSQQNQPNFFGHYKITGYTQIGTSDFYELDLEFIGGNGNIGDNQYYDLVSFVLSTEVPPTVWGTITGDIEDQTDLINYISSQITIPTLQEVMEIGRSYNEQVGDNEYIFGFLGDYLAIGIINAVTGEEITQNFNLGNNFLTTVNIGANQVFQNIGGNGSNGYQIDTANASGANTFFIPYKTGSNSGSSLFGVPNNKPAGTYTLATTSDINPFTLQQTLQAGRTYDQTIGDFKTQIDFSGNNLFIEVTQISTGKQSNQLILQDTISSGLSGSANNGLRLIDRTNGINDGVFNSFGTNNLNIPYRTSGVNTDNATFQIPNNKPAGTYTLALTSDIPTAVTSVTATSPIISSGGTTPVISTSMATNKLIGRSTAGTGVMEEITIGTGLSLTGGILSSSVTGGIPHATASGTDTYTATITGVTGYNDADAYLIRFTNGNTTGATLNINGLGARTLYRNNDGPLLGGDVADGGEMLCIYNSTTNRFQVIGISPNSLIAYVTNADSVTITKGMPVYAFSGQGDRMTVKRANNTGDSTSAQTVGLVLSTSIGVNQKGVIMMQGLLDGLSILPTATWDDGDPVYLGATPGTITNIKPYAPNHLVYLGVVTTASNGSAGRLYVRVQNGYELQELHNVDALNPNNNDGIFYNSTTQLWEHKNVLAVAAERRNANNSTNSSINYCGIAPADSLESASVWTITRLTITLAGAVTTASAINVKWTDRETATYT